MDMSIRNRNYPTIENLLPQYISVVFMTFFRNCFRRLKFCGYDPKNLMFSCTWNKEKSQENKMKNVLMYKISLVYYCVVVYYVRNS